MKWFYKWLSRKIGDSSNDADDFTTRDPSGYQRINKIGSRENTFNINFITAVGGYIIQFVHYDELKDENTAIVYLITDEQDLGKEFSKIVVAEMMKR
jgi:hypothetical protein